MDRHRCCDDLALVGALAALVGSRLPKGHRASREGAFAASPAALWAVITDVEAFSAWRTDVKKVQRLPDREGRAAWIEEGRSGKMTLAVERWEPPRFSSFESPIRICRLAERGHTKSRQFPKEAD